MAKLPAMSLSLFLALFLFIPFLAAAAQVGHYRYNFGPLSVYDIALNTDEATFNPQKPFEISQTYRMGISGGRIASGALKEWKKQGYSKQQIDAWGPQLRTFMPDVEKGDTLRSVHTAKGVEVYKNGQLLGNSQSPAFTEAYFNLWLGPHSTEPEQRNALLGNAS
jgi:hypothetical protein